MLTFNNTDMDTMQAWPKEKVRNVFAYLHFLRNLNILLKPFIDHTNALYLRTKCNSNSCSGKGKGSPYLALHQRVLIESVMVTTFF